MLLRCWKGIHCLSAEWHFWSIQLRLHVNNRFAASAVTCAISPLRTSSERKLSLWATRQPFTVEITFLHVFSLPNSLFFVSFLRLSDRSHTQEQAGSTPLTQAVAPSPSHNRDGSEKVRTFDKRTHHHKPFDRQRFVSVLWLRHAQRRDLVEVMSFFFPLANDHVCMLDTVTGNLEVNSVSSLSDQWEIRTSFTFFSFFETLLYNYCFLYHGDQNISWWRICKWQAVNFEIYLCSSAVNSDLGECFLGSVQAGDRINWPLTPRSRDVYFLEMPLAMLVSERRFGAYVYHRRPVGLHRNQRSRIWVKLPLSTEVSEWGERERRENNG